MIMITVYSYYVLDIIHKGHLLFMKNAKALAGKDGVSVIGILTDEAVMEKKKKPILSFEARLDIASAIKYNDVVMPQNTYSPLTNLANIRPDIAIESSSHNKEDIEKVREYMESISGTVIVMLYFPSVSSTLIKERIRKEKIRK